MRLILKIVLSVVIIFVMASISGIFYLSRGLEAGSKVAVNSVNLSVVNDGIYNGKYDGGRWSNELKVTVKGHRITKVDVVKDVTFSKPEVTKELFDRVVEKQNITVDVVAQSTVTCKAYLKAIENALKK